MAGATDPQVTSIFAVNSISRRTALCGIAALALPGAVFADATRFFRIGTGATSGTYFPLGGELANALSAPPDQRSCQDGGSCGVPGLIVVAQATQGSVENVQMVASGALESALCQADISAWAYEAANLFDRQKPLTRLRALANLYAETVHIVVRADGGITAIKDLRGKRVSLGEPESGTLADARLILNAAGLSEHEVKGSQIKLLAAVEALQNGSLDAVFQIGGYPVPAIENLSLAMPIALVPVPIETAQRLREHHGFFTADTIPAGTYQGVLSDVPTVGIGAQWIASDTLDPDLAYALVKALWSESTLRILTEGHRIGRGITLARALDGIRIPLHPGAERFYREAGMTLPPGIERAG